MILSMPHTLSLRIPNRFLPTPSLYPIIILLNSTIPTASLMSL